MTDGADVLKKAEETFRERNKIYNDNYVRLGRAMEAMFPQGLHIQFAQDWTRLYFFLLTLVKMSRYATQFKGGGHHDSTLDASVYAAMLHAWDEDIREDVYKSGAYR